MDDALNLLDDLDVDIRASKEPSSGASDQVNGHGEFFGPYHLLQEVGAGGVARVLRARHIHPRYADTAFAIKILHEQLSQDPKVVSLFRREAYVLSLLKHQNVVRTFEAGLQDDKLFIAMEYIDGRDLDNMLARAQRARIQLPIPICMHIVGEVLNALIYAHALRDADNRPLGLIHQDVNPANVFLAFNGRVKLGDFGVASITAGMFDRCGELAGKVGYFAPELLGGTLVDQRADVFSVGVMLFELLCGTRLFEAETHDKTLQLNRRAKIPKPSRLNPQIPPELEAIMLRSLDRRPASRYQTSHEMLEALSHHIPPPQGMALAVAGLMRMVFLREHIGELQLQEGLAGGNHARGAGQLVAVATADKRARAAFSELLFSRGYRFETHANLSALEEAMRGGSLPQAILVDVCDEGFSVAGFHKAVSHAPKTVPVVATVEQLTQPWLRMAAEIGAVDLLFRPFNIERVLTAIRGAVAGAISAAPSASSEGDIAIASRCRLLMISQDPQLIVRLSRGFADRGFEVDVSPTTDEALLRTDYTSYHVVLYDAEPAQAVDRLFAGVLRRRPGMGLVPVLFMADRSCHGFFEGVDADRCAVRVRTEPLDVLSKTLHNLCEDLRLGRTFTRFAVTLSVEVRFGGRVFSCESLDLSRGGMMLATDQLPPVGAEVGLSIKLPNKGLTVQAQARVVRVDLPADERAKARLGVEFDSFSGRSEALLVGLIRAIDPEELDHRTVFLNTVSAAGGNGKSAR